MPGPACSTPPSRSRRFRRRGGRRSPGGVPQRGRLVLRDRAALQPGRKHLAEDATQQTFVQAWRAADRFQSDPRGSLRRWLATIARRCRRSTIHRRETRRSSRLLAEAVSTRCPRPTRALVTMPAGLEQWYEAWRDPASAVDRPCPPDEREVVKPPAPFEGLAHTEIAGAAAAYRPGTVKSRSHRAHQRDWPLPCAILRTAVANHDHGVLTYQRHEHNEIHGPTTTTRTCERMNRNGELPPAVLSVWAQRPPGALGHRSLRSPAR